MRTKGYDTVGTVENYQDLYLMCFLRGPEGIIVELDEDISAKTSGRTSPTSSTPTATTCTQRLTEGVANARVLHAELVERGYDGAVSSVRNYIAPLRRLPATPETSPPNVRTVTGWLTGHPASLNEDERLGLKTVRTHCPELNALAGHVHDFAETTTDRRGHLLDEIDSPSQEANRERQEP